MIILSIGLPMLYTNKKHITNLQHTSHPLSFAIYAYVDYKTPKQENVDTGNPDQSHRTQPPMVLDEETYFDSLNG
ncbi:hypothetical protein LXL04_029286 [Taraxacum kok-saghyz]